jgi:hypothetical protein
MVAVIKTSLSIRGILKYNENKVEIGKAECISAVNYLELEKLSFTSKLNRFLKLAELNTNAKRNTVHISLNFDPSENHSKEKLAEIAAPIWKNWDSADSIIWYISIMMQGIRTAI